MKTMTRKKDRLYAVHGFLKNFSNSVAILRYLVTDCSLAIFDVSTSHEVQENAQRYFRFHVLDVRLAWLAHSGPPSRLTW
jgi:hypothetical protein